MSRVLFMLTFVGVIAAFMLQESRDLASVESILTFVGLFIVLVAGLFRGRIRQWLDPTVGESDNVE